MAMDMMLNFGGFGMHLGWELALLGKQKLHGLLPGSLKGSARRRPGNRFQNICAPDG
jgi:hypothetical protein